MTDTQKTYERIEKEIEGVDCGERKLQVNELLAISDRYDNSLINGGLILYKLGFANGLKRAADLLSE